MFKRFILTISLPRDKILVIKMLRAIAGPTNERFNLEAMKADVENEICFDSWMDDYVSLKIDVDEAALGRAAYYQMQHYCDSGIVDIVGFEAPPSSDFTF